MNNLHIYPTSRALRSISQKHKTQDGFLPTLMRMDEFEQHSILIEDKIQIDPLQRILLLREAASFDAFKDLKVDLSLLRFFTKSDALFKFFEELSAEGVGFEKLAQSDVYAEFTAHLEILERLLENYQKLLDAKGFTDKTFIPSAYKLNKGFIESYACIEIYLEGYLSHFELGLLDDISKITDLTIHYGTSKFNKKMQERFEVMGIKLANNTYNSFSLSDKKMIHQEANDELISAKVYAVEERQEQIAVAFREIEHMVQAGIAPEEIVLILPDESFKEHFTLFDSHNNLNFAMGYDYSSGRVYKSLEAVYGYWQSRDDESKKLLERYRYNIEALDKLSSNKKTKAADFFKVIDDLGLHDSPLLEGKKKEKFNERVQERYLHFIKVLETQELSTKEWLFLWLKSLSKVTTDDVRGGLVTVMGVLETRGVAFEGVVIVDFNEGVVPATSSKDQFLNSQVRAFANLPTKHDREALQKQYYKRLLEQAKKSVILYSSSDNKLPSKFLYELGLDKVEQTQVQLDLLYAETSQLVEESHTPILVDFDASTVVWSASRLKIFLSCKRKYHDIYMKKIKVKEDNELNVGSFLHKVLEHLFKDKSHYESKAEMFKALGVLIDTLYADDDSKAQYHKLLWKEKLKGLVESQIEHFSAGWRVIQKEHEFEGSIGGLKFKGRIDRIDQNTTDTLVIDYKSGAVEKEPKTLNPDNITDFQMSIYHQLLQGKYQNIRLAYCKIFENGNMKEVEHLEERKALLHEHIITLKQSSSFDIRLCESTKKCRYCERVMGLGVGEYD